jgi:hypothetical protein
MPLDLLWDYIKVVLAFVFRTTTLVVLVLLYLQFSRARGSFARHFKHAFGALVFLLSWVWVASVAELVRFIKGASAAVELGTNLIFIPNLVLTIWLGRLLWKFRDEPQQSEESDG